MEPKFQTSFIPKNSVSAVNPIVSSRPMESISILPIIANTLFVLTLVVYGGLFVYEKILDSKILELDKALVFAKESFDLESIQNLVVASDQIKSANSVLNKHIAISNMFALLEENMLPQVRFTSFEFSQGQEGVVRVNVDGEASSYSVVAEQSSIFSKISFLKNQRFSKLDLTDSGAVSLKFQTDIDSRLISYTEILKGTTQKFVPSSQTIPVSTTASSTLSTTTTRR